MSSSHWRIDWTYYFQLRCSQCYKCLDIQSFELGHSFLIFIKFLMKCLHTKSSEHQCCFLMFLLFLFVLKCLHTESLEIDTLFEVLE
jgi:hypothetical protein